MLTQSIIPTTYRGTPSIAIGWDGEQELVAEVKRAWFRLVVAYHDGGEGRAGGCAGALRRLFAERGLSADEAEAPINAAREMTELVAR